MAHAQLGDRFSNLSKEEYQQKAQVDCKLEAQAIMQAKLQAPDSNGLVAIMPTAGNGVAPPVTGTKPSPIVSTDSQNGAEDGTDVCVDSWSAAYHKEREAQGLDATVSSDQLGEWQDWCKQGKRPS